MILIITIIFFAAAYLHFSLKTIMKSEPPSIRSRLLYFLAVCLIPLTASVFLKLSVMFSVILENSPLTALSPMLS